jgi:mannose-1-phosphate guanylyltransferase
MVMENTTDAVVVPLDAGWNDIGAWSALWEVNAKDEACNTTFGDCSGQLQPDTFLKEFSNSTSD